MYQILPTYGLPEVFLICPYNLDFENKTCSLKVKAVAPVLYASISQSYVLTDPFWLQKITMDPHILAHISIQFSDDRYPKLQIYTSELILDSCEYIPIAYVTMHCMICP
jgi:hypothetical protein